MVVEVKHICLSLVIYGIISTKLCSDKAIGKFLKVFDYDKSMDCLNFDTAVNYLNSKEHISKVLHLDLRHL